MKAEDTNVDERSPHTPVGLVTICVTADAQADVLLRVAVQLNLLNTAPERFVLETLHDIAKIEIMIRGCSDCALDLVRRKLEQLTCVIAVSSHAGSRLDTASIGESFVIDIGVGEARPR